jgi:DNA mismatch repair protein MutS2
MHDFVYPLVDLIQAIPTWRVDPEALDTKLVFCFAGSSTGGLFADTMREARLPPSTWTAETFVHDLFVERMVRDCFGGANELTTLVHLGRVLCHPPTDAATVETRREILKELVGDPAMAERLRELRRHLNRFRNMLETGGQGSKFDMHRHQLDVLAVFSEIVATMGLFTESQSALRRLSDFGQELRSTEPFQSLEALLAYDGKLATLDFRVQIGADGRVRHLELQSVQEATENPFVASPLRRWAAKFELLLRGFRFGDGEVLARLIDAVFEGVRRYFVTMVPLFSDVEFYLGALHFRARAEAAGLSVCLPRFAAATEQRRLVDLFNPLLLGTGSKPVPCNIETDRFDTILLITGPNSGGKTRLLQSLGLTQLLAQAGLFVPAREAVIAPCPGLVVSLIQETSADQPEGRLGMELMRIRHLFERLPVGAAVILDELCSGTNPSEGEEIFELVVKMLSRLRLQAFITTHFLEFAARLKRESDLSDLRFLQVQLGAHHEPTYQFSDGVAETSLANHAAARLGVTGEQLLALIDHKLRAQKAGHG